MYESLSGEKDFALSKYLSSELPTNPDDKKWKMR